MTQHLFGGYRMWGEPQRLGETPVGVEIELSHFYRVEEQTDVPGFLALVPRLSCLSVAWFLRLGTFFPA
jgi:hypothetical protein